MIVDALLSVIGVILSLFGSLLPDADLDFNDSLNVSSYFAFAGPVDKFFPLAELLFFLDLMVSVWMPAALAYTVVKWVYRHLPVIGKG